MGMGDNEGAKKTRKSIFAPVINYVKEVKSESKKVVWPSFSQTAKNTTIVVIFVLIIGVVIGVLDLGFSQLRYLNVQKDVVEEQGEYMTEEQMLEFLGVTGDELTAYQAMSDEEKNAFIQQKLNEMSAAQSGSEADSQTGSETDGE